MRTVLILALLVAAAAAPAYADVYPVTGRFGVGAPQSKDPIDCKGLRVIAFNGDQRTDSKGGVPTYRNFSVTKSGSNAFKIVDQFNTGQINARASLTLRQIDDVHIELDQHPGGLLKLQRCK